MLLDWPTARFPAGATAITVAHDTIVSASAAYVPPCTRPNGCCTRRSTGQRARQPSPVASSSSKPSTSSSVPSPG